MADLPQVAYSAATCVDWKNPPSEIPVFGSPGACARSSKDDAQQLHQNGGRLVANTDTACNKEEKRAQKSPPILVSDGKLSSTQVDGKQKCNFGSITAEEEDLLCQKFLEGAEVKEKTKGCETPHHRNREMAATALIQVVDVGTCGPQSGNLCANARKQMTCEEGESEFCPSKKGTQGKAMHAGSRQNKHERQQEQSIDVPLFQKQAGWTMVEEPEFTIEDSSWPTLAEARNAKSIRCQGHILQARASSFDEGMDQVLSTPQRVPSRQAKSQECPVETLKHTNANISTSKSKPSNKRGGFCKPNFTVTEHLPGHPIGVHAPNVNMFIPDHTFKGNGLMGINNYFPGPHQAPAHGPFYFPRAESLALFPHSPAVPHTYGRGLPVWQHFGRGYSDSKPKHAGFRPPFDQQLLGPRHMHPPVAPFMNVTPYNYSSYQGEMTYLPGAPSLSFNYVTPYFRPSWHQGGTVQAAPVNIFSLQEMLQKQIEYYFSVENLCHDTFLISKMNDEGFVPLSLIASFPRVRGLTCNTMIIVEALKNSAVVEVKNGQLRSYDWRRWKVPSSSTSGMQSNPSGLPNYSTAENVRVQENGGLQEFQEGHLDNRHSFIRS